MKKVYLILTLFVTSLFFYSSKVYAATYTYELTEEDLAIIDDEFLELREKVIKYVEDNNSEGYWIGHNGNIFIIYIFNSDYKFRIQDIYTPGTLQISHQNCTWIKLNSEGGFDVIETYTNSKTTNILSSTTLLKNYIDTSFNVQYTQNNVYLLNYKDTTYTIQRETTVPTLYQIYLDHNVPTEPVDKFLEEKEIINNFYSTIFTKIGELATNFANNYTFLLILGIFILIFIFEIIRRRII